MSNIEKLIEINGLKKAFRVGFWKKRIVAVHDVSFDVRRGEIFGLIGPNGAGKTTTIKVLTGLMHPTEGEAKLFGMPTGNVKSREKLGYLPEGPYFYEHLNPRELLEFYGRLFGLGGKELNKRIDMLIERVGLGFAADRPIRKFSKGMRQRAGLAQALINDPELVILDEPQSGLDPTGRKEVRDLILDLKREGKTIMFSSHILPDVEAVCDRVAVMHLGLMRDVGTLAELTGTNVKGWEVLLVPEQGHTFEEFAAERDLRGGYEVYNLEGPDALDPFIDAVRQAGRSVHSVLPVKDDLEAVFLRDTEEKPS